MFNSGPDGQSSPTSRLLQFFCRDGVEWKLEKSLSVPKLIEIRKETGVNAVAEENVDDLAGKAPFSRTGR